MPSSTSSSEPRRWPRALLLAIALFAISDHVLWSRPAVLEMAYRYTPRGDDGDPLVAEALLTRARATPPRLVLLGSSQVREGLDCDELEPLGTCLNLAQGGGTPLDALYLARRISTPDVAVIGIFPKVFHLAPKTPFVDLPNAWLAVRAGGLPAREDASRLVFGLLQQLSPTLRFKDAAWALRDSVRGDWASAWRGTRKPVPTRLLANFRRQPDEYFRLRTGIFDPDTRIGPWDAVQEAALERLAARRAGRSPLVVIDFPTHPDYPTTLEPAVKAHYEGVLARLRNRSDVMLIERRELPPLPAERFLDFTHVDDVGRTELSQALARRLEH